MTGSSHSESADTQRRCHLAADSVCVGGVSRYLLKRSMAGRGKLIAVIGDEDTCTGFLLGGVGELNKNRKPNFLVVEKDTSITEIEETFK